MNENVRVGDQEREAAVKRLGEHYEAGRLTAEEHSERISQALQAKTAADLTALFADLPGEKRADEQSEAWAGPFGWTRPPWTSAEAGEPAAPRPGARRPGWAARGPLARIPLPLLIALAGLAVLLSVGCVVGGGHPPVLPLLLIVAAVVFVKKRRHA
ncbi:DUF1707 SHOCT-like domain-containing protein [Kribbella italica]|uniref:DUF1707 domain-containing protein n=1 Tax=Kribbella italica TaxID=1540520 RepID=A0A7W9JGA4_9ACTN|nr:DUF1707 domain-containing protein [Kribbella italica]MBB5841285.1 hypothetical protein [Kribbella italica]